MTSRHFWVIGGEYRDTSFRELTPGTSEALGPFQAYDDALRVWRDRSLATRPKPHVRYTIAADTTA